MTNKQELKCLFGHHDFFQKGCARQCIHCKATQVMDIMVNGTLKNPKWIDIQTPSHIDLKELSEAQEKLEKFKQQNGRTSIKTITVPNANDQRIFTKYTYATASSSNYSYNIGCEGVTT